MTVNNIETFLKNGEIKAYEFLVENPEKSLVLIHGMGEHVGRYKRLIKKFNEAGMSVFAIDMRGHGNSIGPMGHCAPRSEVLSDVDQLIEKAIEKHPKTSLFIYGHSFGGNVVLDYRRRGKYRNQLKGYILSAPWVVLTRKIPLLQKISVRIAGILMPTKTFCTSAGEGSRGETVQKAGYKKDPLSHKLISYKCAVDGFDIADSLYKGKMMEDSSKAPMLIMHGTEDKMCHVSGSEKIAQNEGELCELAVFKDRGHDLHRGKSAHEGNIVISKAVDWINSINE